jgi:hypothetical protein
MLCALYFKIFYPQEASLTMIISALSLDQVTIGAFFGLLISLPIALFLVFWLSAVKNRKAVILGGVAGAIIAFLVILAWAGTLIHSSPMEGANGASAFFGGLLLCSAAGLVGGIIVDLIVASRNSRDYRRQVSHE